MLTIHGAYNYPPVFDGLFRDLRPLWAAEELGLDYAVHWLDPMQGQHREAGHRAVNPFGLIPALRDGDLTLFESGAICLYLFEKAGRAPAGAAARARLAQWCFAALNTVEPPLVELAMWDVVWRERDGRDERRAELLAAAKARLAELDGALGGRPYLLGEELAAADVLMVAAIRFARHEAAIYEDAPSVRDYVDRCEARPAFVRAGTVQGRGPGTAAA
jgi:glutathione S-transferase